MKITKILIVLLTLIGTLATEAATISNINVSTPNSGAGDPLRTAMVKINANFNSITQELAQVTALGTNAVLGVLASPGLSQHVDGRGAFHTWTAVQSNLPVRFAVVGDSVAGFFESTRGVRKSFDSVMESGGFGSQYWESGYGSAGLQTYNWYLSGAGASVVDDTTPTFWLGLTNGQVLTAVYGSGVTPSVNKLSFYYKQGPAFGSMLVETNIGGGSWGSLGTINATGTAAEGVANFQLSGVAVWNFRITSTASNVFLDAGMQNTLATNTHSWGRQVKPAFLIEQVITNAAFYAWYSNYAPHCIFFEGQDPVDRWKSAMQYAVANFTNSDLIFITPSPSVVAWAESPDNEAKAIIEFARTNTSTPVMCFNKNGLLQPTNYWHSTARFPKSDAGVYKDDSHLGAAGIIYTCTEMAKWFGAGQERFAFAGLAAESGGTFTQTNDTSKANLSGINYFSGNQYVQGSLSVTNSGSDLLLWQWNDPSSLVRLRSRTTNNPFQLANNSGNSVLTVTNLNGVLSISTDPFYNWTYGSPAQGVPNSPYYFRGNNLALASNSIARGVPPNPETAGQMILWNSNGAELYLLKSGTGLTWTSTNKWQ